jgi:hypothetical protein
MKLDTQPIRCQRHVGERSRLPLRPLPLFLLVILPACVPPTTGEPFVLEVLSTRPYLISDGNALLRVEVPPGTPLESLLLVVDGSPSGAVLRPAPNGPGGAALAPRRPGASVLLTLIDGLRAGDNRIELSHQGSIVATLPVTSYPRAGPMFSGSHLAPYFCLEDLAPDREGRPRRFALGNGEYLTHGALDGDCSLSTRVDYVYRPAGDDGSFLPLEDLSELGGKIPTDVATTTTSQGETVPFVVRLETGTINRAIYQIATLVDPVRPAPELFAPYRGWNGRLVYTYGGGCEAGFFQGTATGGVLREGMLAKGYAIASSTLNVNAQGGCNDPLSAETTLMVKEHFAETFGPPVLTIGSGGSGGAMQQLLIAGAYPGILDGLLLSNTFPDAVTYFVDTAECRLPLRRYLNGKDLPEETKRVIGGWALWSTCDRSLGERPNRIGPDDCPEVIPVAERYHPVDNPTGVRCSIYDGMRNVFGTRLYPEITPTPMVPFGRSPHGNAGVQYGLLALEAGRITKELFLDLNEGVGGWDIDFEWRPERAVADPEAVRIAYSSGRVTSGAAGLRTTPIIDERRYLDDTGNFHTSYYSFVIRERLLRDNGHADNYVIQRHGAGVSLADENLALMDVWLTAIAADAATVSDSADDRALAIVRHRPFELRDVCYTAEGERIEEPQHFDQERLFDNRAGTCNELYPPHTGPRMVAGGPLTNDVLQCTLKPLRREDYAVDFTDTEWSRLAAIFPQGVCDWTRPGIGQEVSERTWLSFGPSPVNRFER